MAGTVTETREYGEQGRPQRITLAWLSNSSGDVSGTPTVAVLGEIVKVTFSPNTGGTKPTDNHDITLLDATGVDVLAGLGGNLDDTVAASVVPGVSYTDGVTAGVARFVVAEPLNLVVANAGNAKGGTVVIYVR